MQCLHTDSEEMSNDLTFAMYFGIQRNEFCVLSKAEKFENVGERKSVCCAQLALVNVTSGVTSRVVE